MRPEDVAYIAGLFDGEGSVQCKQKWEKKKKHKGEGYRDTYVWRISMEIGMTDYSVLVWLLETLGVGTIVKRNMKGTTKSGGKYKQQWRWRCTYRDAYYVSLALWPYTHVKLDKIQQIIEHYSKKKLKMGNVVNLEEYRGAKG